MVFEMPLYCEKYEIKRKKDLCVEKWKSFILSYRARHIVKIILKKISVLVRISCKINVKAKSGL